MADNVTFQTAATATPPDATTIATDDVSGAQFQRIKLDVGGDGTSVPVVGTIPLGTVQVLGSVQGVGTFQMLGTVTARTSAPASPFGTRIAGTVGNLILLAANPARLGAALFHEAGGGALYLKLGSLSGTFDYTLQVPPGGYYEVPFGYTGTISGIWAVAGGSVQITEVS